MPVALPSARKPVPVTVESDGVEASRRVGYRVDILDMAEELIGELEGVQPGGSLDFSAQASIKGSGKIPVLDLGSEPDWLNVRLKPYILVETDSGTEKEIPLGVFLPAAPVAQWSGGNRSWNVELLDKLSILDQDIIINADGEAVTYSVDAGENVIVTVRSIIAQAGETSPAIAEDPDADLTSSQVFEVGTTRLQIINQLLSTANYFSLYCDGNGQYQARKYQRPANRTPIYGMSTPFSDSSSSILAPAWTLDEDIYSIPNRYWVQQQSTGEQEGDTAVAKNEDPESPFSFQARGRWITQGESGVEATGLEALQGIAERKLDAATSVTSTIEIEHVYLEDLDLNSVIRFNAGNVDYLTTVTKTKISLDPDSLTNTTINKVARQ